MRTMRDGVPGELRVRVRTRQRTAVVSLFGELDIASVAQVGDAVDSINLDADGFRHVVLDLRGLTFMDATGIHELIRQSNGADANQHDLTVVRGRASVSRLMRITAVDKRLVLVERPQDLAPPSATH